ncbi:MAG: hypothetical protein QW660_09275 [Candidatus Bathyarchaeia archaeon]
MKVRMAEFKALDGVWHWFTGEMKGDAFKFNLITEKILQENGSYEVKFEEKGSRIVRLHVLEPQKFDPKTTLFVVSCTDSKIWSDDPTAPDYVPARFA